MSAELWILLATSVLAVVAITAAVVAVRAARRIATATPAPTEHRVPSTELAIVEPAPPSTPAALVPRVVQGQLIVPPTQQQVVATALGRPGVRLSVLARGLAHALRPESRDRIVALMRREYRRRRRERLQAGRTASRAVRPTPPSDQWLGS
jgi:hypothetical protein